MLLVNEYGQCIPVELTVTKETLSWKTSRDLYRKDYEETITLSDVIALHPVESDNENKQPCFRLYYVKHLQRKLMTMTSQVVIVETKSDETQIQIFETAIRKNDIPKRLLVFINPISGRKMGLHIYRNQMVPLFKICGIQSIVIVTTRRHHVTDVIEDFDLASIDGIVTVGGDGLYSECVNALLNRGRNTKDNQWAFEPRLDDHDQSVNGTPAHTHFSSTAPLRRVRSDTPVGIIPAGSGNVLVSYLHGNKDIETSVLHVIKGRTTRSNVAAVYQDDACPVYSTLILGFGLSGEMVRDCEKMRWFGPSRYTVAPLRSLINRRMVNIEVEAKSQDSEHYAENQCGKQYYSKLSGEVYSMDMWVPTLVNDARELLPVFGDSDLCLHAVRRCSLLKHLTHLWKVNYRRTRCFDFEFIDSMRATEYRVRLIRKDADRKYYINNDGEPILLRSDRFDVRLFQDAVSMYGTI